MPDDKVFGSDFSFKSGNPWERDSRNKRLMQRRGKQSKLPGKDRSLTGLPEDYTPEGKGAMEGLNERFEKNKWDQEQFAAKMDAEDNEDAAEDEDAMDEDGMTDGERFMWRFLARSKPSDKRLKPQKWIDERRAKRRMDS